MNQARNLNCKENNEIMTKGSSILPQETTVLSHQIAGHFYDHAKNKLGMLSHNDGSVLKPVGDDVRGLREQRFYESIFQDGCQDPDLLALRNFVPIFQGIFETEILGKSVTFMKLKDITSEFENPSVMDVKVGRKTYDPEATDAKIEKEIHKYPHMSKIGFKILGMRVYDTVSKQYVIKDKEFGLALNETTVSDGLRQFFLNKSEREIKILINSFLVYLRKIQEWFEGQRRFAFYSSSLLFVYGYGKGAGRDEANGRGLDGRFDGERVPTTCVKMIDFAHVFRSQDKDENYFYGLVSLIRFLEQLLITAPDFS